MWIAIHIARVIEINEITTNDRHKDAGRENDKDNGLRAS
jgi:hypothetical protein